VTDDGPTRATRLDVAVRPSAAPAATVALVSALACAALVLAATSSTSNPAIFWFGVGAVLCGSLSIVLIISLLTVLRSGRSPLRWRRVGTWTACLGALTFVGIVLAAQGASEWCSQEGFRRASGFGQSVAVSPWPPGVKCTLTFEQDQAEVFWPINW